MAAFDGVLHAVGLAEEGLEPRVGGLGGQPAQLETPAAETGALEVVVLHSSQLWSHLYRHCASPPGTGDVRSFQVCPLTKAAYQWLNDYCHVFLFRLYRPVFRFPICQNI